VSERSPAIDNRFALSDLVEATRNGLLLVDNDQRVVVRNTRLLAMFGVTDEQLNAKGNGAIDEAVAPFLIGPLPPYPEFPANNSEPISALDTLRLTDGRVYERYISEHRVRGVRVAVLFVYSDITALAQKERLLERDRQFLEKAQEVAHIGSWATEIGGPAYLAWSPEMFRILGLAPGPPPSRARALAEMVHPDDRESVMRARAGARGVGDSYDVEHRIIRPDGTVRWVHVRGELVGDVTGNPARVVGTMQDVTRRRELEEQLRHSQRIEALGRLAGGVAHDLNNALNVILGYTEVVLEETRANPTMTSDMEEIRRATERAASTVRQLLAFSRKQRFSRRAFHVEESIAALGRMFERILGPSIVIEIVAADDLPPTFGDAGQVEQAIVNLAINSRDAMPDGGRLTFRLDTVHLDHAFVLHHPELKEGRYIRLAVGDSGHGMTADILSRIFDPFFTTKEVGQGTGLGLSMVYGTMQQIGGCITVSSEPGAGTTFELYFPAVDPGTIGDTFQNVEAPPYDVSVLVVDDEEQVCELAAATLRRAGYSVMTATSGHAAIEIANDTSAVDVLLTDLRMPGMNGGELARVLSMTNPQLRIVVMSGFADDVLETADRRAPIARLDKPFTQAAHGVFQRRAVDDLKPRLA
jgi:two-component system, cell cycle sensor histidine kinase and response regulator CckA